MKFPISRITACYAVVYLIYPGYGCKNLQAPTPEPNKDRGISVLAQDLVYAQRQVYDLKAQQMITVDLKMDIVGPPGAQPSAAPRPLIIFFHGENMLNYYKHVEESYKYYYMGHQDQILKFAQRYNCVVASVNFISTTLKWEDAALNYYKTPLCKVNRDQLPPLCDSIEEKRELFFMISQGKDAVRFLKSKHAEYNFDLSNITIAGYSAGGMIASGVGFIDDPNFKPAYANAQNAILYNSSNKYPCEGTNVLVSLLNIRYQTSYSNIPSEFSAPVPRPDLGSIEGSNTSAYDSKVKNVVLFCTAIKNPITISKVGPRLFIYGHDDDGTLKNLNEQALVPCMNAGPMKIFNDIRLQALSVGYVEGDNLKVIKSLDPRHEYTPENGMLEGQYGSPVDAAWDFIN